MWERVLLGLATAAAPLLGLALTGTRRNRLRGRAETYSELADKLQRADADSASKLRTLVHDMVAELIEEEERALRRRFDVGNFVLVLCFAVPSVVVIIWSWQHGEWWRWLVLPVAGFLLLVSLVGGGTQLFKTRGDPVKT